MENSSTSDTHFFILITKGKVNVQKENVWKNVCGKEVIFATTAQNVGKSKKI